MGEAPTIFCPKENREVPIWWCLGSFIQGKEPCPELIEATVYRCRKAEVVCTPRSELPETRETRRGVSRVKGLDLKNREKTLKKAYEMLKMASTLIYASASGVQPFRISKMLNIMGKTTYEDSQALAVILGIREPEDWRPDIRTLAVNILLAELEDRGDKKDA